MEDSKNLNQNQEKIFPWVVVLLLCAGDKIILAHDTRDIHERFFLLKKEGGALAQDLEFSYSDTIEKILKEYGIHAAIDGKSSKILFEKDIEHPKAKKVFIKLFVNDCKILPGSSVFAGLYFPKDVFVLPLSSEERKIITREFHLKFQRAAV